MKFAKILLSIAAALFMAQVHAAGVSRLTGSYESSLLIARGLLNLCNNAGGHFTLYKVSPDTSTLDDTFDGTCSVDFSGTTVNDVRVYLGGEAESAMTHAWAFPTSTATIFLVGSDSCTALAAGTESLSFLSVGQMKSCGTPLHEVSKSDGGFVDMDGTVFNADKYDSSEFQISGFSQVFGIAVNRTLYNDLQAYQKTAAGGNIVASTCAVGDTTPACQPSLSRAQVGSLINNDYYNAAKTTGGAYLVPGSSVSKITYCQGYQSTGIQQAAQLYFLNYAANGELGGTELVTPWGVSTPNYASVLAGHSSDIKTCLNDTSGYKFGVLSLQYNPIGRADIYRFVRINEVPATEGIGGASQKFTALSGRYDFVYDMMAYCPSGGCADIISAIESASDYSVHYIPGMFGYRDSHFNRGGNPAAPYIDR